MKEIIVLFVKYIFHLLWLTLGSAGGYLNFDALLSGIFSLVLSWEQRQKILALKWSYFYYQHTIHTQIGTFRFPKKYLVKMGTKCECLIPWTTAIVICETNLTDNWNFQFGERDSPCANRKQMFIWPTSISKHGLHRTVQSSGKNCQCCTSCWDWSWRYGPLWFYSKVEGVDLG